MSWSLGEIRALSVKAARGAGLDWGLAEEAGFAVEWLESHGLNGVQALAQYLSKVHRKFDYDDQYCPLKLGCYISDMNDWTLLQDKDAYEPTLLIPFLANLLDKETLAINWDDNKVLIQKNHISTSNLDTIINEPCKLYRSLSITLTEIMESPQAHKTRVPEDVQSYVALLNALAHKTYAPSTEASRLAGAGAGLNDND